ncbi:hypothetical protein NE850_00300 [Paraburkholderia sp. USG1]|jgi:hypothetical protein|uniref:hypothetical protein n=2 Tax=unclassified Paraburkholderia TaxID=2615204 RepID=UPI00285F88A4|nr:hypothetical protein [Paraburkholderia sp. USG1]MDR8394768.1 hypothetical protein [Paraburkholderia sp. USG1]
MSHKRKKASTRRRLTRELLLPIPARKAQQRSIQAHMALETLRLGQGNGNQAGELIRSLYMTWLIACDCGEVEPDVFLVAEAGLHRCIRRVPEDGSWSIDATACDALKAVLSLQDDLLATVPAHVMWRAARRLDKVIDSGRMPSVQAIVESGAEAGGS